MVEKLWAFFQESTGQAEQLTRSSLGRVAFIGELYDVRTESFTSRSLLQLSALPGLLKFQDTARMELDYGFAESISERSDLINVEAELQMSVLLGIVSVGGSGKFLAEESKSEKSVSCSLVCKMHTVCEKLFAPFEEVVQHSDLTALEAPEHTHVVVEVNWGANFVLTLEASCESESKREDLKGRLKTELAMLKKMLSVKGEGCFRKEDSDLKTADNVKIKVCADIVAEDYWPTSTEGFCKFLADVPTLLRKFNDGKGKPLNYVMIPLDGIRKLANVRVAVDIVVRNIDESFLVSCIYFFEDISRLKRKLHDWCEELKRMQKYVADKDLSAGRDQLQSLSVKETELKMMMAEDWGRVKAGTKSIRELIRQFEMFKRHSLNLTTFEGYLEACSEIRNKLSLINHFLSLGVTYLGKGESFSTVFAKNPSCEFLVLLVSSKLEKKEPELHANTCFYFLSEARDPKAKTKYVIVDLDYEKEHTFMNASVTVTKCLHLIGNKVLSSDKYADYVSEKLTNFARSRHQPELVGHKPGNRVPLEMVCPGFENGTCPAKKLLWTCFRCKSAIEYGFDHCLYCSCGMSPASEFEFRCNEPKHGDSFAAVKPESFQKALSSLRPLKELNVLILGQSGVGKSTWINSIINYLIFESLDKAREHGVICSIPTKFVFYDPKTLKKHVIQVGQEDKNEVTDFGASATQSSRTYTFILEGKFYRIIDTPGLGDCRGIDQDKKNLRNIINHISYLKELHGVCILLKTSDYRINAIFGYCVKELLTHLHKSIAKNIVFCFTNARNSLYSPGQSSVVLEKLIENLGIQGELALGYHNMFCLDNEAFLFLCSSTNPEIHFEESHIRSFTESWEISLEETKRLFRTIMTFTPHLLKETLSLITARNRIMALTQPIAEISKTIQINVASMQATKKELIASEQTLEELEKKLNFTEVHLESIPLDYPRTVCTSPSCVEYLTFSTIDIQQIHYKKNCHERCFLKNIEQKTVNNVDLKKCDAIGSDGKCRVCGCRWECHMHITFIQVRVEKQMVKQSIERDMMQCMSEKESKEKLIKKFENSIAKYKEEQEFIVQASIKFGMFLQRNAITMYNDSVEEYLEYLITEEENKPFKTELEKKLLASMKDTLAHYKAEVAILQEVIKKGEDKTEELTVQEVLELERSLYMLELTGKNIKRYVEMSHSCEEKSVRYTEIPVNISRPSLRGKLQKIDPDSKKPTSKTNIVNFLLNLFWA